MADGCHAAGGPRVKHAPGHSPTYSHTSFLPTRARQMAYRDSQDLDTFLVPLGAPHEGWLIQNTFRYKTGKAKLRSCNNCRNGKLSCVGVSRDSKTCEKCRTKELVCLFGLTDSERTRLEELQRDRKLNEARIVLGLQRAETGLGSLLEPALPSLKTSACLVDAYFSQDNHAYTQLTPWMFDLMYYKEPVLLWAVALNGLNVAQAAPENFPIVAELSPHDQEELKRSLFWHVERGLQEIEVDWIKYACTDLWSMATAFAGSEDLVGSFRCLLELSKHMWRENPFRWRLQMDNNVDLGSWIVIECIRRTFVRANLDLSQLLHGEIYPSMPWGLLKHTPLLCSDELFWNTSREDELPKEKIPDFCLTTQEWNDGTLEWFGLPRGHAKRERCLKQTFGDLKSLGAMNLTFMCVQLALRCSRGKPSQWPGFAEYPIEAEDLGPEYVSWEEFESSWEHWDGMLNDVWKYLPAEVVLADMNSAGLELLRLGKEWFVLPKYHARLLNSVLYLHEARLGVLVRSMVLTGPFTNDDCLVDVFLNGQSSNAKSDILIDLLRETMSYIRLLGSCLHKPEVFVLAVLPTALRVAYIHLAVIQRLQRLQGNTQMVQEAFMDAKLVHAVMANMKSHFLHSQVDMFARHLYGADEVRVRDARRNVYGGFGFLLPTFQSKTPFGSPPNMTTFGSPP